MIPMRSSPSFNILRVLLLTVAAITLGCDGGGSDSAPPIGPDIRGSWSGRYYVRGASDAREQAITATISQDGDAIILKTSLIGVGANLTGTLSPDGEMTLIDALDAEIWTTFFQPVSASFVQVADFTAVPQPGESTPLQIIELSRAQ